MTFCYANTPNLAGIILSMLEEKKPFAEITAEICEKEELHILIENNFREKLFSCLWTAQDGQSIFLENEPVVTRLFTAVFEGKTEESGILLPGIAYTPVIDDGAPEGILFITYRFPYTDEQAVIMAENISRLYLYSRKSEETDVQRSHFVTDRVARDLLLYTTEDDSNGTIYLKNIKRSFPKFAPPFIIMTFSADSEDDLELSYSQISRIFPNSFQMYKDSKIYVFLYRISIDSEGGNVQLLNTVQNFTSYYSLYCGISQAFDNLSDRNWYRRQSNHALLSTSGGKRVCSARKQHMDVILSGVLSRYEHNMFNLSTVEALEQYDADNQTTLLPTLYCYLEHFNHPAQTAAELFIDRSTLKSRLEQIKELVDMDIEDPKNAELIRLAILVHNTYIEFAAQHRCDLLNFYFEKK